MNRFDDGELPHSETVKAVARVMNQCKRHPTTARMLQDAVDFLDRVINDDGEKTRYRLEAVDKLLKMEAQNQVDEIKSGELADKQQTQERVVLLLPPNGTEKRIQ